MKTVKMVKTSYDGTLHESVKLAVKHLDRLYGDKLRAITLLMCKLEGKYGVTSEFIDENLSHFVELAKIKADMEACDELKETM